MNLIILFILLFFFMGSYFFPVMKIMFWQIQELKSKIEILILNYYSKKLYTSK